MSSSLKAFLATGLFFSKLFSAFVFSSRTHSFPLFSHPRRFYPTVAVRPSVPATNFPLPILLHNIRCESFSDIIRIVPQIILFHIGLDTRYNVVNRQLPTIQRRALELFGTTVCTVTFYLGRSVPKYDRCMARLGLVK